MGEITLAPTDLEEIGDTLVEDLLVLSAGLQGLADRAKESIINPADLRALQAVAERALQPARRLASQVS